MLPQSLWDNTVMASGVKECRAAKGQEKCRWKVEFNAEKKNKVHMCNHFLTMINNGALLT